MRRYLLAWYKQNNIQYPWRGSYSPYKVWTSEIMLQQTQVNTVIPYYIKWVKNYPTINSIANADLDDLLKLWEGLGYYARVRNFHSACKVVINEYNATIPNDNRFIKLPGVGEYIDAAVRSICFNTPIPVIDGNVKRVMSRYLELSIINTNDIKKLKNILTNEIDPIQPGNFNQALMDLGRFICKSAKPHCNKCPIHFNCLSYINKTTDSYPRRRRRKQKPHHEIGVAVIWKNNKILLSKRKKESMLGGLWEFPGGKIDIKESTEGCIKRKIKEELNINIMPYKYINSIEHTYSHFSISMHAFHCNFVSGKPKAIGCDKFMWVKVKDIASLPFPKANHKLFNDIPTIQP